MPKIKYIVITDSTEEDAMEVPIDSKKGLDLPTLNIYFPNAIGLKFKHLDKFRAVNMNSETKLFIPDGDWIDGVYYCVLKPETTTPVPKDDEPLQSTIKKETSADTSLTSSTGSGSTSNNEDNDRPSTELVVLNLPYNVTDNDLKKYFEAFGTLEFAKVKKHSDTGKSRGYGFIRYSAPESALKALTRRHKINNRCCDVRVPESNKIESDENVTHKIYVGPITKDIKNEDLKELFEKYGEVNEVFIPKPFRQFAFVKFKSASVAKSLYGKKLKVKDIEINITAATPKKDPNNFNDYGRRNNNSARFENYGYYGNGNINGGGCSNRRSDNNGNRYNRPQSNTNYRSTPNGPINPWLNGNNPGGGNSATGLINNNINPEMLEAIISKTLTDVLNIQQRQREQQHQPNRFRSGW